MRIKPADGLVVRDPETKAAISSDGIEVNPFDLYWAARLRDGDVVLAPQEKSSKTKDTAQ